MYLHLRSIQRGNIVFAAQLEKRKDAVVSHIQPRIYNNSKGLDKLVQKNNHGLKHVMCSRIKTSLKVIKWCIMLHQGNDLVKGVDLDMPTRPLIPYLNL